jgi:hypothetical protein
MAPKAAEEQKAGKSKAEKKPVVKKAEKKIKADTKGEGKKSKKSVETYKIYIYKVLKQVCVLGDHSCWFSFVGLRLLAIDSALVVQARVVVCAGCSKRFSRFNCRCILTPVSHRRRWEL